MQPCNSCNQMGGFLRYFIGCSTMPQGFCQNQPESFLTPDAGKPQLMQQLLRTFRGAGVWEFQIQKCCYLLWFLFGFLELNSLMEMDFRWLQAFPWSTFLSRFRCCACRGDSVLNVTKTKSAIQKVSNRNHVIACFWKIPNQQDATRSHSERSVRNSQRARSGAPGFHGSSILERGRHFNIQSRIHTVYKKHQKTNLNAAFRTIQIWAKHLRFWTFKAA